MKKALANYFALLRLPNLLTVPGDVLAGWVLAGGAFSASSAKSLLLAVGASLFAYSFGIVLNDVFDVNVDRKERPWRPIPSGAVAVREAVVVCIVLALAALNLASRAGSGLKSPPFAAMGVLLAAVVFYDLPLRRKLPALGIGSIAFCRFLNVIFGAVCVVSPVDFQSFNISGFLFPSIGAVTIGLYTAAFSIVASGEAAAAQPPGTVFRMKLPFLALVATLIPFLLYYTAVREIPVYCVAVSVFGAAIALIQAYMLSAIYPRFISVSEIVGRHICNLLRIQAAIVLFAGNGSKFSFAAAFALFLFTVPFNKLSVVFKPS